MGAGINDCVGDVVVGEVRVIGVAVEGKLQNPCPGHVELVAEGTNVWRDHAKILRNERQHAQLSLHRAEEISARTWDPLPGLSRSCPGRYVPGGREPAKMIQTDHVHVGEQRTDAIDAPAVAGPTQGVPVVDRVAPELSLRAKIIRRHAGYEARPVPVVQQEELRVGPNVARVRRDKKGQVTYQAQAPGAGMFL